MTNETQVTDVNVRKSAKKARRDHRPRMDSVDRRGVWAPPGGRELYLHSHLSDAAGELESDGQEQILEPTNLDFVERILTYEAENEIPIVGGLTDEQYRNFSYKNLGRLLADAGARESDVSDSGTTDTRPIAIAAIDSERAASARLLIEQIVDEHRSAER